MVPNLAATTCRSCKMTMYRQVKNSCKMGEKVPTELHEEYLPVDGTKFSSILDIQIPCGFQIQDRSFLHGNRRNEIRTKLTTDLITFNENMLRA